MRIIETYTRRLLSRKMATLKRQIILPNPDSIRKVGVLWLPAQRESFQYLYNHFSSKQIVVRNLCVYLNQSAQSPGANTIVPKEISWLGIPKKGIADDFLNMEFDLLFNIALEQNLILDYLTGLSLAHFKIGWSPEKDNFFDLNINIRENEDAMFLVRQQIFYLSQLNKTAEL